MSSRFVVRGLYRQSGWEYGVCEDGLTIAVFSNEDDACAYARWRNGES